MIKDNSIEFRLLADFVRNPNVTQTAIDRFQITPEHFADDSRRAVFTRLQNTTESERAFATLYNIMAEGLNLDVKTGDDRNDLLDNHSDCSFDCTCWTAHRLSVEYYNRRLRETALMMTNTIPEHCECDMLLDRMCNAFKSIPRPPRIGTSEEEELAREMQSRNLDDIPDKLLHVPGFIDEVVEYSIKTANNPNRTLSFAGALALTAHLAGRRYADPRGTRTNLYIFALGPSGCGKEHTRKINRAVARATQNKFLPGTILDRTASGEAIETTLMYHPRALFQMDEIQDNMVKWKDGRNPTALSIAQYLMTFYTASGGDYTARAKATDPKSIGHTIYDPSLTLFATGISEDAFKALTPSIIKEGLVGRCLMFDSEHVSPPNPFDESAVLEIPQGIVDKANLINNAAGGMFDMPEVSNPKKVAYDTGVKDQLDHVFRDFYTKAESCRESGDEFGAALWARASEKISKLALLAAISINPQQPLIRCENVAWAVELINCLIPRMLQRIDTYMATGKVQEIANVILNYLALPKNKGRCTQHELIRHRGKFIQDTSEHSDYRKAITMLVHSGQLDVANLGRGSVELRLIKTKEK